MQRGKVITAVLRFRHGRNSHRLRKPLNLMRLAPKRANILTSSRLIMAAKLKRVSRMVTAGMKPFMT